ncbi:MAG: DUF1801 domain-containing protein [Bacteroidetes bacterium]|nr:DUF1801 domain-containing protein [Bacteroidota bacterium]
MATEKEIENLLAPYDGELWKHVQILRAVIFETLPKIQEQVDIPANMIAYSFGRKYAQVICVIIPSKKGLKLGFNRGNIMPDPNKLLQGTGKISRYIPIDNAEIITTKPVKEMLKNALLLYQEIAHRI